MIKKIPVKKWLKKRFLLTLNGICDIIEYILV